MRTFLPVLVHGWGFDANFWQPLWTTLGWSDPLCIDLGFFNNVNQHESMRERILKEKRPLLFISHSLGFLWVLSQFRLKKEDLLVGMNAFSVFGKRQTFQQGVPQILLDRMQKNLCLHPQDTLRRFYQQCRLPRSERLKEKTINCPKLKKGLDFLAHYDGRRKLAAYRNQTVVLASYDDPIVPHCMTKACFETICPVIWHRGGHLLPLVDTQKCADFLHTELQKRQIYVRCAEKT